MRSKKKLTNKQTRAHAHRLSRRHTRITQAQEKKEGKKVIHLELFDFFYSCVEVLINIRLIRINE